MHELVNHGLGAGVVGEHQAENGMGEVQQRDYVGQEDVEQLNVKGLLCNATRDVPAER